MKDTWPPIDEVRAMSDEQLDDLRLTLLADLNGSISEMVGPFRRWADEGDLFAYLIDCGIYYNNDQGRFFEVDDEDDGMATPVFECWCGWASDSPDTHEWSLASNDFQFGERAPWHLPSAERPEEE